MIYEWKEGSRYRGDPQIIGETIAALAGDGVAPPEKIVASAQDPASPLHSIVFRLDREQAADAWYLQEARQVVNDISIVIEGSAARPAAFLSVNLVTADGVERGYARRDVVLNDVGLSADAVREALAALNGWRRRYRHLSELSVVFDALDTVEVQV